MESDTPTPDHIAAVYMNTLSLKSDPASWWAHKEIERLRAELAAAKAELVSNADELAGAKAELAASTAESIELFKQLVAMRQQRDEARDYSIALQRAIEHHRRGVAVPPAIADNCPHHAQLLNEHLASNEGGGA